MWEKSSVEQMGYDLAENCEEAEVDVEGHEDQHKAVGQEELEESEQWVD